MDQDTLKKLIANEPKDVQAKAAILYNAVMTCAKAYQTEPTAARQRDWKSAEEALALLVADLGGADPDVRLAFPSLGGVLEYLRDSGWKVTKSSLYRHHGEGKLLPKNDGAYQLKDVEKYARTWLKQSATGKRVAEKTDELQRKKLERELANLELKYERETFAHARDLGQYVPKELMEIELAGRAGILDAGLKHWIQSRAADWIRSVDGDMKKVGELINIMNREADEHINTYATPKDYEIIIEGEEAAHEAHEDQEIQD